MARRIATLLAAAVIMAGVAGGCASEREAQYTATGAGIGAITGGILGGVLGSLSGRAAEGVVIGSIFGGLAGASVGHSEYHQHRSYEEAQQVYAYDYENTRRDLLRIEDASVSPDVARPGDEVTLSVTYTLLGRRGAKRMVREVREIRKDGRLIGRPEITSRRKGGTWASSVPIVLPHDAETGTYVVTTIVETDNSGDVRESTFYVERSSRWRR